LSGLSEWVVRSPKEVYGLIKRGSAIRATGSTKINETSSRSHALFIIIVEQNEIIMGKENIYMLKTNILEIDRNRDRGTSVISTIDRQTIQKLTFV
jgi:hypothetical protein